MLDRLLTLKAELFRHTDVIDLSLLEHQSELEAIEDDKTRERRLVELNVVNSAMNVASTTIVQNAWERGQKLAVHGWAHNIEDG